MAAAAMALARTSSSSADLSAARPSSSRQGPGSAERVRTGSAASRLVMSGVKRGLLPRRLARLVQASRQPLLLSASNEALAGASGALGGGAAAGVDQHAHPLLDQIAAASNQMALAALLQQYQLVPAPHSAASHAPPLQPPPPPQLLFGPQAGPAAATPPLYPFAMAAAAAAAAALHSADPIAAATLLRPPPPSYNVAMQEHRWRMLFQERLQRDQQAASRPLAAAAAATVTGVCGGSGGGGGAWPVATRPATSTTTSATAAAAPVAGGSAERRPAEQQQTGVCGNNNATNGTPIAQLAQPTLEADKSRADQSDASAAAQVALLGAQVAPQAIATTTVNDIYASADGGAQAAAPPSVTSATRATTLVSINVLPSSSSQPQDNARLAQLAPAQREAAAAAGSRPQQQHRAKILGYV